MTAQQGRAAERMGIGVITGARETGGHRSDFRVEKWDLDQITWTQARDYDGLRMLGPGEEAGPAAFAAYRCQPFEVHTDEDCNLITDAGWGVLMSGIAGTQMTNVYSTTHGAIGCSAGGASPTTVVAAYADTNLAYTTACYWQVLSANPTIGGSPQHTTGLVFAATFATGNANWQWLEVAVDQHTASTANAAAVATMLNHIGWNTGSYTGPGTKTSAQTWNATLTITWS